MSLETGVQDFLRNKRKKIPPELICPGGSNLEKEAPPGFEPGMADLQSAALATWLRRLIWAE